MIGKVKKILRTKRFITKTNGSVHKSIELRNEKYVNIGVNCAIGENSKLLCWDTYAGYNFTPNIKIGNNFIATRSLTIQCCGNIIIGDDVLIASNVFICDYNHGIDNIEIPYVKNELVIKDVIINDGVWIGQNSIILPAVKIGEKAVIGAGSVVTKNVLPYTVVAGNPAKPIKKYDFKLKQWIKY